MNTQFALSVEDIDAHDLLMQETAAPLMSKSTVRIIGLVLSIMALMFLAAFLHSYPACIPVAIIAGITGVVYRNMSKETARR